MHAGSFVSTACIVASNEGEDICSVHLSIIVSMSQGILERPSASQFSLPGRYLIVRWKSANSATHLYVQFVRRQHIGEWVVVRVYSAR